MQCLAFLGNGDVLAGDSGGVILIWSKTTVEPTPGKGPKGTVFSCSDHSFQFGYAARERPSPAHHLRRHEISSRKGKRQSWSTSKQLCAGESLHKEV